MRRALVVKEKAVEKKATHTHMDTHTHTHTHTWIQIVWVLEMSYRIAVFFCVAKFCALGGKSDFIRFIFVLTSTKQTTPTCTLILWLHAFNFLFWSLENEETKIWPDETNPLYDTQHLESKLFLPHWNLGLFISRFMIMASNMGPSRMTNSMIRWMSLSISLSVGMVTRTMEL